MNVSVIPQFSQFDKLITLKQKLGANLEIVGHHYQQDAIVAHANRVGDSLELARMMDDIQAEHVVFCGVHFMAETAALLAKPGQKVYLPDESANCVMARMAPAGLLDTVLTKLTSQGRKIIPLAYVNTTLAVKAVVGAHGGATCTSANAKAMLEWALKQGDAVLFLPDKNLGNNAANQLGLPQSARHVLNVRKDGALLSEGGEEALAKAQLLFWPGCCAIHAHFHAEQVHAFRNSYPGCQILVHPECSPAVVVACDGAGSTSYLIKQADEAADNSTLIIGTEINLVRRLANKHAQRLTLLPLAESSCSHMARISPEKLLENLEAIDQGRAKPVEIASQHVIPARLSLERMLQNC